MIDTPKKAVFNWSGGKDSSLALYKVLQANEYEVVSLLTTVNRDSQRSSMHGIPVSLLQKQANSIGIPLFILDLIPNGIMIDYEEAMSKAVSHFKTQGVTHFIFGDIFLHDVKSYRESKLRPYGIEVVEPLWGKTSAEIMDDFLASGLQTVIVTTNASILNQSYIGRTINASLIQDLPSTIDICGENGEYHTFCYDGGMFKKPIPYLLGEPIYKTYPIKLSDGSVKDFSYWFANLQDY